MNSTGPEIGQGGTRAVKRGGAVLGDGAAVHGEDVLHRVDEAAEVADRRGGQHDQDAGHGQRVQQDAADQGPRDRERHVALGVGHLLAGAAGQLETDEVEQQHADQEHETALGRLVAARAQAVRAVPEARR